MLNLYSKMKNKKEDFLNPNSILRPFKEKGIIFRENDIKEFKSFSKNGLHFNLYSYEVEGYGRASIFIMRSVLGIMKMCSFVFTPLDVDIPLGSFDEIRMFNKRTTLLEFYNTNINEYDDSKLFKIKEKYKDLKDRESKPQWYDYLLSKASSSKVGKSTNPRMEEFFNDYLSTYIDCLLKAEKCDHEEKRKKCDMFTKGLLSNGGPAVNFIKKAIGEEKRNLLVSKYIFGTDK